MEGPAARPDQGKKPSSCPSVILKGGAIGESAIKEARSGSFDQRQGQTIEGIDQRTKPFMPRAAEIFLYPGLQFLPSARPEARTESPSIGITAFRPAWHPTLWRPPRSAAAVFQGLLHQPRCRGRGGDDPESTSIMPIQASCRTISHGGDREIRRPARPAKQPGGELEKGEPVRARSDSIGDCLREPQRLRQMDIALTILCSTAIPNFSFPKTTIEDVFFPGGTATRRIGHEPPVAVLFLFF